VLRELDTMREQLERAGDLVPGALSIERAVALAMNETS
jgi:hypothetical protein